MIAWWRRLQRQRAEARRFREIPPEERRIVVYSEGRGYWTHFEPVVTALVRDHGERVLYVTSDEADPVYRSPPPGVQAFWIGDGSVRTLFFAGLQCRMLLMTLPDLHSYQLKRSPHGVYYVYLHHSMVSTHMIYRAAAFDHFDAVLCTGPHHVEEIRTREQQQGLPDKQLVEHGYGRLDGILAQEARGPVVRSETESPQVLVAPTWGDNALLERHGVDAVRPLLEAGLRVVLRPHPRTCQRAAAVIDAIVDEVGAQEGFTLDMDTDGRDSLLGSDLMISDWSGAALEFALGLERPVLFVDVPRKVNNPDYEALGIEPLEARIREQVGRVVAPDDLAALGERCREVLAEPQRWRQCVVEARHQWVFHPGDSGRVAAEWLCRSLQR
ncbi:MAG: CDP-glycerol glycerophosphotransferase family protein [Pseudohongiellaceae bacterium]